MKTTRQTRHGLCHHQSAQVRGRLRALPLAPLALAAPPQPRTPPPLHQQRAGLVASVHAHHPPLAPAHAQRRAFRCGLCLLPRVCVAPATAVVYCAVALTAVMCGALVLTAVVCGDLVLAVCVRARALHVCARATLRTQ